MSAGERAAAAALAAEAAALAPAAGLWLHAAGKDVIEVRVAAARAWQKGEAVAHLLQAAGLAGCADVGLVAVGDDEPDEAMFAAIARAGCGAAVSVRVCDAGGTAAAATAATHIVHSVDEVAALLGRAAAARGARE